MHSKECGVIQMHENSNKKCIYKKSVCTFHGFFQRSMVIKPSIMDGGFEITLDEKNVLWFSLGEIESALELKRRFISAISRCYKTEPYRTFKRNIEWQQKHISAFNKTLGTKFNIDEITYIYTYLGNGCNKPIAIKFIESGYDLNVLKRLIDEKKIDWSEDIV